MATTNLVTGTTSGGIDVASIVTQLMAVERQPLTALQQQETKLQNKLSAFGRVQSALSTLQTASTALRGAGAFAAATATVTGSGAAATAGSGAAIGRYAVSVSQLARAQSTASAAVVGGATATVGSGTLSIQVTGSASPTSINVVGTDTLADVRDKINAANAGVAASIVNDGTGARLVLNASKTGAASAFTVTPDAGLAVLAFSTTQAAQDARFAINGLPLTSPTNQISDAIPGVTLTLTQAPTATQAAAGQTVDSEVAVDRDAAAARTAAKAFVDAYNALVSVVRDLTAYNATTKTAATLNGESVLRGVISQARSIVVDTKAAADGELTRLSSAGIAIQADGTLGFDAARFDSAYAAGAERVARMFGDSTGSGSAQGFAARMASLAKSLVGTDGLLASRQQGLQSTIKRLDDQQSQLEARLDAKQKQFVAQYSSLNALLNTNQQQSVALANALSKL
ncbi:MAG: flagellar filament capping protein FliD [Burkholderiaceae bacterium]|jgi:flagellar hook-associated protein 2|nr:flagellar filament capping protein FliD [Burkholderiaceae bacterium]